MPSGPGGAWAQTAPSATDGALEALHLKARLAPAPDFVVKSRRPAAETDYIPVGRAHNEPPLKTLSPAEVAATEADLDAAREAQRRRAGLKPSPVPLKPPKASAATKR